MSAQSEPLSVLTVNNGLSSGTILHSMFDSRGFLWVSTNEGLHRYDGKNIVKFFPNQKDSAAIHSQIILTMAEDKRGRIFIAGEAIEVFLPEENRFQVISNDRHEYYQPGPAIWIFEEDQLGIVLTIQGPFVFSLDELLPVTEFTTYSTSVQAFIHQLASLKQSIPLELLKDPHSNPDIQNNPGIISIRSAARHLWISTRRPSGFVRMDEQSKTEWKSLGGLADLIDYPASLVFLDYNDSLAIAGVKGFGLVLFNKESNQIIRHWDFRQSSRLSRVTWINPLCKDHSGRVWFSIMAYGVFVLDPLSQKFIALESGSPGSVLYHGLMKSMHCDQLGRLWIGFQDGYVQILDASLEKEIFRKKIINVPFIHNSSAYSIISLPGGDVLVNGQLRFSIGKEVESPPTPLNSIPLYNFHGAAYNTLKTPKAIVIPAKDTAFSLVFYDEHGTCKLNTDRTVYGPEYTFITDQHHLLVHFYGYYTDLYSIDRNQLNLIRHFENKPNIKAVYQEPGADSLWLATPNGLTVLNLCTYTMRDVNVDDWPSKYLYGILPDDRGYLWISTNAGIIRYQPATGNWKCFNVNDGMQSNEFNSSCYAILKDGTLVFGGPEGLNAFHPAYFDSKKTSYRVHLTDVRIEGQGAPGFNSYNRSSVFTMHPDEKSIEFEYSSTQFSDREDLTYFIRLDGVDADWVNMGNKEFIRYVNLKPGDYRLHIKAQNAGGFWSSNVEEAGVRILPAFYQTTWFKAMWILLIFGLLYAFYQYRIFQLRKLWQVRNRISNDLHDDVGSTLGSISIYSEVAKNASDENRDDVLNKIGDTSREMIEKLNDIVWTINPENDSIEKIESRIRNYASMMLNPLGINFTLTVRAQHHQVLMDMNKRRNLFLIVKEAIHNAAKYADCKQITLRLEERQGRIYVEIADDGKGFDPNTISVYNGHGLKSMRERARSIQAKLNIVSSPGNGTLITLES